MENNQPKKKNASLIALIALLLIITTLASCLGIYAWAKYLTSLNDSASVDVAKWNFNLTLRAGDRTVTTPTQTLDLATTMYTNVANDRIAPGTSGEFDIVINTVGTEVSLNYEVTIAISDCPRNITFSRQQGSDASTLEVKSAGGTDSYTRTITFSKYLAKANASGEFVEKIKWNWPYEGTVNESSSTYDTWDTTDQGKNAKLAITVVGTEVLEDPARAALIEQEGGDPEAANSVQSLAKAGTIQKWDKVNYNPGTLTTASIELPEGASIEGSRLASISSELPAGATLNGTIDASDATEWVVLDVNETTGEVKIIPRTFSSVALKLEGIEGYTNAIEALDSVASIYLNPSYAKSAKSITIEDVNRAEGKSPSGNVASYTWNHRYGMDANLNITDAGDGNTPSQTYTSTAETGYYNYTTKKFNNASFWLASRCVSLGSGNCDFRVRFVGSGFLDGYGLFFAHSSGTTNSSCYSLPVLPVVTLKSGIKVQNDGTYTVTGTASATATAVNDLLGDHNVWNLSLQ